MSAATVPFLIGLDYELFFGPVTGSVERCLIEPTRQVAEIVERHGVRLTLFADAAYLARATELAAKHARLERDLRAVREQLRGLMARGHDVQLHIHPHWEHSSYDGETWTIHEGPYRLQDFPESDRETLVRRYKSCLEEFVGADTFAYRAGGWCVQPFGPLREPLLRNDVWLDSTVFAEGRSSDSGRGFDFRGAPGLPHWRFDDDPLHPTSDGAFVEVPIASMATSPSLYWRMSLLPRLRPLEHRTLGDGRAMGSNAAYYAQRLLFPSHSPVTIDGVKAEFLPRAHARALRSGRWMNVMGHPKAISPFGLAALDRYLAAHDALEPLTFRQLAFMKPRVPRAAAPRRPPSRAQS